MRFAVFVFLIAFLIALTIPVSALDGWNYYRPITITNNVAQTLTDYQVSFTLNTANLIAQGKMRSDCGDLRVTLSDGQTLLPYWIEPNTCNTNNTRIWTKVPSIPESGSATIYVWYGNPQATSQANASATFYYYDNGSLYSTWSQGTYACTQDTADGNPAPSYKCPSGSGYYMYRNINLTPNTVVVFSVKTNGLGNFYFLVNSAGAGQAYRIDSRSVGGICMISTTSWTQWSGCSGPAAPAPAPNTWYKLTLVISNGTSATMYYLQSTDISPATFGNLIGTVTITNNGGYIGLVGDALGTSYSTWWDNIIVRKYVSPEPSVAVGNELIAKPDLTVISADYSPKPASVQQQVNISAQIANIGNWTSPIANVTLYINGNAVQTAQISGLNPNGTTTVTFAWIPNATGNYTATITVDPDNVIDEISENNNSYNLTIEVSIAIADLIVSVALPQSSLVDKEVAFSVVVANIGNATAYNFSIVVYLDSNKLDERRIASLDPNGQVLLSYSFTPREARIYTINAIVDPENSVIESAENNNAVSATIKVVAFGDIVKIPTPPKPEGKSIKEIFEDLTLKTYNLPLETISLITLLGIAVVGYGFGAFKGTVNLFFLSVLYYIAANALGWSTYIATGLLVVSAILLVIVVAFLKED